MRGQGWLFPRKGRSDSWCGRQDHNGDLPHSVSRSIGNLERSNQLSLRGCCHQTSSGWVGLESVHQMLAEVGSIRIQYQCTCLFTDAEDLVAWHTMCHAHLSFGLRHSPRYRRVFGNPHMSSLRVKCLAC